MISYLVFFLIFTLIFSVAVLGLNLQWGFAGLFNAGVVGFMAVGAYTTAILFGPPSDSVIGGFGLPFPVALAGGMAASAVAAWIVARATIRMRHEYLAVATFGIAISIQLVAVNTPWLTGGTLGLIGLPKPLYGMFDSIFAYNLFFLAAMLVLVGVLYWGLQSIMQSPWGRALKSIRENEEAAAALGKDCDRFRIEAFVLGCMLMGMAGGLFTGFIGYVSPSDFEPTVTFQIWTMLILGGSANNRGALIGALIVWGIWTFSGWGISRLAPPNLQAQGGGIQVMLIGFLLVATLLVRPRGLIGEEVRVSRHVGSG